MSIIGSVGHFNEAEENFESYATRVELFFEANSLRADKKGMFFFNYYRT